ncbi:MAG: TonB-dependent receptor [Thermodesulfobacteriota bacterium]
MMKKFSVLLFLPFICLMAVPSMAEEPNTNMEDLLFEELPIVITAARMAQVITDAPSTVMVLTAKEIKRSGARNVPDALRKVPGLDVIEVGAGHFEVSARGFSGLYANKMLVMIDGRTIYQDFFGAVEWSSLPIGMDEINRIEVVLGPGSALYGANAFNGVINIITKSPDELKKVQIKLVAGEDDTYEGSLIHANTIDNLGYKLSAGWNQTEPWADTNPENAEEISRANGSLQYNFDEKTTLDISAGYANNEVDIFRADLGNTFNHQDNTTGYTKVQLNRSDLMVRFFWNNEDQDSFRVNTYDAEFQNTYRVGDSNLLLYGGSYRNKKVNSTQISGTEKSQDLYSAFLQDEFRPSDKLIINAGLRYDDHPIVDGQIAPRLSALYKPSADHSFRASWGIAYRNPTFLESYQDYSSSWWIPNPWPAGTMINMTLLGSEDLDPEEINSFEIGYQGKFGNNLKCFLNLFHNTITNLIIYKTIDPWPTPMIFQRANVDDATAMGGEIGFDYLIAEPLKLSVNYSYQDTTYDDTSGDPLNFTYSDGDRVPGSPEHKANATLDINFESGISAQLSVHYVGKYNIITWNQGTGTVHEIGDHTLTGIRLAKMFMNDKLEWSVEGFNIFDVQQQEFPLADELASRWMTTLRVTF